ncbi:MAG: AAA family ATPase [Nanoarchaeota archaeon]|nr:AAA family ATPase [Nanoarchaeota archaeon]
MDPFFVHKPKSLSEIKGQPTSKVADFFTHFRKGEALFIYGPHGTGKTSSVYAFAAENNYEVMELNAGDTRNQKNLTEWLSQVTGQASLFGNKKIILLDEVDGLSGVKDRGATGVIAKFISTSLFPIVITGVDVFDKKFSALKKSCDLIEYKPVGIDDMVEVLKSFSHIDTAQLRSIARNARGDVRAALNDLFTQIVLQSESEFETRKQTEKLSDALIRVFKSTDPAVVLGSYDDVSEDLDKIFLWVDQNIPKEYTKIEDIEEAYGVVAQADRMFGRIRRWQYYRFYVYCYLLLSVGVALSKEKKYPTIPRYSQPSRLLKYWQANMTYAKRKSIVEKIALSQRISTKNALIQFHLLIPSIIGNKGLRDELEITSDELAWVQKKYGGEI